MMAAWRLALGLESLPRLQKGACLTRYMSLRVTCLGKLFMVKVHCNINNSIVLSHHALRTTPISSKKLSLPAQSRSSSNGKSTWSSYLNEGRSVECFTRNSVDGESGHIR